MANQTTKLCCIKECPRPIVALGLCSKHWRRNKLYGSPLALRALRGVFVGLPSEVRFNRQVNKTDYCWEWIGPRDQDGYGVFRAEVGGVIYRKAHRFSWVLHTGELILDELVILHQCDNPCCVNPDHLSVGTTLENVRDKITKGRQKIEKKEVKLTAQEIDKIANDVRPHGVIGFQVLSVNDYRGGWRGKIQTLSVQSTKRKFLSLFSTATLDRMIST